MGHQIIEQPDGKLCVYSTFVDGIIISDATGQELLDYYAEQAAERARDQVSKIIAHVRNHEPEKAYYQFAMTYEEAMEMDRKREAGELDD